MMRRIVIALISFVFLGLLPSWTQAAPTIPPAGLAAEGQGRWTDAVEVYKKQLVNEPDRIDLWLRIADIEATLGHRSEVINALENVIKLSPKDHALVYRLAQTHAQYGEPSKALEACERALALDPKNMTYLQARSQYATWINDYTKAAETYAQMLNQDKNNIPAVLGLARVNSWTGDLDQAAEFYQRYLKERPDDEPAMVEYIKAQTWRGDYHAAMSALETYRKNFGETKEYKRRLAIVQIWVKRPSEAKSTLEILLNEDPDDFELNYSMSAALRQARMPKESVESLKLVEKAGASDPDKVREVKDLIMTPVRSLAQLDTVYSSDSDKIDIWRSTLKGAYFLDPATELHAGVRYVDLSGKKGSGLEAINGDKSTHFSYPFVGLGHRFSPGLAVEGEAGPGYIRNDQEFTYWKGSALINPSDNLDLKLTVGNDLFDVSPRAVSLGVERTSYRLGANWQINELYYVVLEGDYSDFSDSNKRWELVASPRRVILRSAKVNLDLGLFGLFYGYDKDLNNGYYDPGHYQMLAVAAYAYYKIDNNNGISLTADLGFQKDDAASSYEWAGDISIVGEFGIFNNWYFRPYVGHSHRTSFSGEYDVFAGGLMLTRRF